MNEENTQTVDTGFEDFVSAFDDSIDYQSDAPEKEEAETENQDTEVPESEQSPEEDTPDEAQQSQEDAQDTPTEAPEAKVEEAFTLKINKQERTVSRAEMINLAQKGADYDRVKEQLKGQQEAMDVLSDLAKDAGTDIPGLLKNFRLNLLKKQGLSDDAAQERLLREAAEKENARLKKEQEAARQPAEDRQARIRREVTEFREHYPNVQLSNELIGKLTADVQKGKSLTEAYRSYEAAQKDARIAQLEQQLAAEKQNKANRAASPGSQKDSGGKRSKSDFDEFMEAFA
jgi:hypothetical protein